MNSTTTPAPLLWIAGGMLGGLVLHYCLLRPIALVGARRGWYGVATISRVFSTVIVLWGALAGFYIALGNLALAPRTAELLDRLIAALAILSITWVIARFASTAVSSYGRRSQQKVFSSSLFASVIEGAVVLVGLLTVLSSFGISIAPLLTTLGLGGLAVALALRDTLANLFSGIQIVAAQQFRPGDHVKLLDPAVEGEIADIQWRSTTILDPDGNIIVVPNEKMAGSVLVRLAQQRARET